ncbi:UDP-N-acetylglucosamine 2-epimerase [hydrothermal vent metagenome]|uniref:UDP-N-acetylglucosamine 2-epimerase (non-hydrolyzing) n=1 Tax=hydrothermal vent metagenome TaxID=652676 RepID=A0A3B0VIF0_9ZZZZ
MLKALIVFGTRPEAIKMAPLVLEFKRRPGIECKVCVTAQHREMLDQILRVFDITPDYDLDIMKKDQDLFDVTSNVLLGIKDVIKEAAPDIVFVQGDTTTAMAAALAAFYLKVKVGHVEAGLRTNNKAAPFPEEINRRIVSTMADYHFVPTQWSKENLIAENIAEKDIYVTGNTVVDALLEVSARVSSASAERFKALFDFIDEQRRIVLITGHRRENFGSGFKEICGAIKELAEGFPDCDFIYPVHLNPNVRRPVAEILGAEQASNIHLIEPLEYEPFVYLLGKAHLILTDSGGIQEEAPSLGKPVLVMREVTERPEGVEAGSALLVGARRDRIIKEVSRLLTDADAYKGMAHAHNPYGDGQASLRISDIVSKRLCSTL